MGHNSERKEFSPLGENSFLLELIPLFGRISSSEGNQEGVKVISLRTNGRNTPICTHTPKVILSKNGDPPYW